MTTTDTTIREIQERFDRAEMHDDRDTLGELIDQEFLSIGPKGFLLDKQQWIDRHEFFPYHELDVSEVDIRLFADTAIVRAVQRNRAEEWRPRWLRIAPTVRALAPGAFRRLAVRFGGSGA